MGRNMDSDILIKRIWDFKELINSSNENSRVIMNITVKLSQMAEACVYIINNDGKLLITESTKGAKQLFRFKQGMDGKYVDAQFSNQLNDIAETRENIELNGLVAKNISKSELSELKALALPIIAYNKRLGTMLLTKTQSSFEPIQVVSAEFCSSLISLILVHEQKEEDSEMLRRQNIVQSAISTLSYSELEAMLLIFDELPGNEGLLVASKIADKVGITRSVIVNALRKLESAGVIESRSLGMKGTYIKVLNDILIEELNKLRRL